MFAVVVIEILIAQVFFSQVQYWLFTNQWQQVFGGWLGINFLFASQATNIIQESQVSVGNYIKKPINKYLKVNYCDKAKDINILMIFINLFLFGIVRLLVLFTSQFIGIINSLFILTLRDLMGYKFMQESTLLQILTVILCWPCYIGFNFGWGFWPFSQCITGTPDPSRPIRIAKHLDQLDGIFTFTLLNQRGIADNTVKVMPGVTHILKVFDWMVFDRTNAAERKNAVYMSIEHLYWYEKTKSLSPIVIFPEGALCTKGQMLPFKVGAFNALRGVQYFNLGQMRDQVTGLEPSPAKTMPVTMLTNFARTYNQINFEFLEPVDQSDYSYPIDTTKPYDDLRIDLETNRKEDLKKHSALQARKIQQHVMKKQDWEVLEENKLLDGQDAEQFYAHLSKFRYNILDKVTFYMTDKMKGKTEEQVTDQVIKEEFEFWITNHRMDQIRKMKKDDRLDLQHTNEEQLAITYLIE